MSDIARVVFLVRHAKAVDRDDWSGDDLERPLTKSGRRQAESIAALLAREKSIDSIRSSPALRCVDTVAPLAERSGLGCAIDAGLLEGTVIRLPRSGRGIVLCAHGDNIPWLLESLGITEPECRKGSIWRLAFNRARALIEHHYIPPPDP